MQEATVAADPGRRPAQQQFAGVDLRRPKGYAAAPPAAVAAVTATQAAAEGDPCPRCESTDTKFCYYNNYNTSQPRHFCKGCRRYWTKGGTLRNVPVGGGTRKKPSSSPPSSYAAAGNSGKPKKPYKKKRRVVAAAPPPEPAAADAIAEAPAADYAKTPTTIETTAVTKAAPTPATEAATPTTTADAASEITTELVVPAAAATEEEDSLAHLLQPDVALGLGISDFPAGKGLLDAEPADSFEWPAAFDLGTCWGSAGFADMDPAGLFLNLP